MLWYVYELGPIDHNWERLQSVRSAMRAIGADDADQRFESSPFDGLAVDEFLSSWEGAKGAAARAGWEGDFRQDPVVFWVPDSVQFRYGFTFKQDNNGTTWVVSPVELTHLREYIAG